MGPLSLILLSAVGFGLIGGTDMILRAKAQNRDQDRVCYSLTFPPGLEYDKVVAWLRAISRTTAGSHKNHAGAHSLVFETVADQNGIQWRLIMPWQVADDITAQTRALMPGVNVKQAPRTSRKWRHVVEVGLKDNSLPIHLPSPESLTHSLLASLQPLRAGESMLLQWVVVPASREALPNTPESTNFMGMHIIANSDLLHARREKLEEPNLLGVLRVAVAAEADSRARHLADRLRSTFRSTETPFNTWQYNKTRMSKAIERATNATSLTRWPAKLSIQEFAALIGWPVGDPHVSGLPKGSSRHLPAMTSVSRDGLRIGSSTFPGDERPLAIDFENTTKHIWIVAPTGTGKTVLMSNLTKQIMDAGLGMLLVETKHDLFNATLDLVPSRRLDDAIIMDVNEHIAPTGFNMFEGVNPDTAIDDLEHILGSIHGDDKNVWFKEVIYHGMRTLMTKPGATVADLSALLSPRHDEVAWRDELIRNTHDPNLKDFWERLERQGPARRDQIVSPVLSRLWHFSSRPTVRSIFGQRSSTFSIGDAIAQGKIVLVNLTGIDSDAQKIIGSVLVNSAWREVRRNKPSKPFYLVADEAQNIMHLPIGMSELLSQSRSFNFPIIMANQSISQLGDDVLASAAANARTKITFQLEVGDAKKMAATFGGGLTEHDLMNLDAHEGYARISTSNGVSPPMSFHASPVPKSRETGSRARMASRRNYGKPIAQVESEIKEWRRPSEGGGNTRRRPRISGQD